MKEVGGRREGGSWIEGEGLGFYVKYVHTYIHELSLEGKVV